MGLWHSLLENDSGLYRVAIMRQQVSLMGVEGGVSREALTVPVLLVRKAVDIVRTWNRNHLSTGRRKDGLSLQMFENAVRVPYCELA